MSFSRTCLILAVWAACTCSKSSEPSDAASPVGDDAAPGTGGSSLAGGSSAAGGSSGGRVGSGGTAAGGRDAALAQGGAVGGPDGAADLVDSAPDAGPPLARTFTQRTSPVSDDLEYLASSGEVVVAAGKAQLIFSDDGVTWSAPNPPVAANAVAFGGGTFVALGDPGIVFTSPDGKNWTQQAPFDPTYLAPPDLAAISYAFGRFIAVSFNFSDGQYVASSDGVTWKYATAKFTDTSLATYAWSDMMRTCAAGDFVFVSSTWPTTDHHFRSQDGITWDVVADWTSLTYDVAYDGKTYCSVGSYSGGASTDGKKWTTSGAGLHSVVAWNGVFFAVGGFGDVRASRDCQHWETGAAPTLPEYLPSDLEAGLEAIRVQRIA